MTDDYVLFSELISDCSQEEIKYLKSLARHISNLVEDMYVAFDFGNDYLIMYSDSYGDIELAAWVIQRFIQKFRPGSFRIANMAYTCSEPTPGKFGGTSILIHSNGFDYIDPIDIARKIAKEKGYQ